MQRTIIGAGLILAALMRAAAAQESVATAPATSTSSAPAEEKDEAPKLDAGMLSALKFRNIGPAVTSGRIVDLAVHPQNRATFYVAVASGGVWKTINGGTTFSPMTMGKLMSRR